MTKGLVLFLASLMIVVSCSDGIAVNSMDERSPEDIAATNDAIARFVDAGIDPRNPRPVEFQIFSPNESSAKAIKMAALQEGLKTEIFSNEGGSFTVLYTTDMALLQPLISAMESKLDLIASPHGGYSDGWGAFE